MNLELTPTLEQFVHARIESGEYQSQSEVVCEALRLLMKRDEYQVLKLQQLRAAIEQGDQALASGDYVEATSPKELDALFAAY